MSYAVTQLDQTLKSRRSHEADSAFADIAFELLQGRYVSLQEKDAIRLDLSSVWFIETGAVWLRPGQEMPAGGVVLGPGSIIGLSTIFADGRADREAVVLIAGSARCLSSATVRHLIESDPHFATYILRSLAASEAQLRDQVARLPHLSLTGRLASMLLQLDERGDDLRVTQDMLAEMVGAQRTSITAAAQRLKAARVISYIRGRLKILDRDRLAQLAMPGSSLN